MNTIRAMFLALVGTAAILPGAALAEPLFCEFNGHHYEVIDFSCNSYTDAAACWDAALTVARSRSYAGAFGKLATITSPDEQECVADAWSAWSENKEVWIGGYQEEGAQAVDENWKWIDGDGGIPGTNPALPATDPYANWGSNEPNDVNSDPGEDGGEDHLGLGLGGVPTWNDEGAKGNIFGAAIEYETSTVIEDIGECLDPEGCPLNDELTIIYEDVVCLDEDGDCSDATLEAQSWQVLDPRVAMGQCGAKLLNLSLTGGNLTAVAADTPAPSAVSTLPRHLCGHPNFVVTKTDVDGFKIGDTPAIIETDPPPGNNYECGPLDLTDPPIDNTVWDVTGYQTSNKFEMVETGVSPVGLDPLFADGTVLESTFDCSSSRGKGFRDSWYFSGLCIAFGASGCPTGPTSELLNAFNFDQMNQFLIYKLNRIADVLKEAKSENAFVRNNDYNYLKKQVAQAIKQAGQDEYYSTFDHIENAQRRLASTRFRDVPDERYPAELDTRLSNAAFTSENKILRYVNGL